MAALVGAELARVERCHLRQVINGWKFLHRPRYCIRHRLLSGPQSVNGAVQFVQRCHLRLLTDPHLPSLPFLPLS
jgi:hypothetical protein